MRHLKARGTDTLSGVCSVTGERACECGDFPTTINTPDEPR